MAGVSPARVQAYPSSHVAATPLTAFQPAEQMQSFLGALAELGSAPAPDVMASLFTAHGMTMLGPPLPVE